MPYKIILAFVNIASCYWSIFKYARYFAKRHLKVVEDEKAVEVILRLEEEIDEDGSQTELDKRLSEAHSQGRRMTVTAVSTRTSINSKGRGQSIMGIGNGARGMSIGTHSMGTHSIGTPSIPGYDPVPMASPRSAHRPSVQFVDLPFNPASAQGSPRAPVWSDLNWGHSPV
jgi:hypothetical protein